MQVVIERESVLAHRGVERFFPGVAEGRMPNVMDERQDFGEIDVQREGSGNGPRNLRDFERMSQAVAEVVRIATGEDLCFGFQTAESASMDNAVPVTLEIVAVGMLGLGEAASAGLRDLHRVRREHPRSLAKCGQKECRVRAPNKEAVGN